MVDSLFDRAKKRFLASVAPQLQLEGEHRPQVLIQHVEASVRKDRDALTTPDLRWMTAHVITCRICANEHNLLVDAYNREQGERGFE